MYLKMAEEHFNRKFEFYFIVLGKKHIGCEVYKLSNETRAIGENRLVEALNTYKKCKETGVWTNDSNIYELTNSEDYEVLEV